MSSKILSITKSKSSEKVTQNCYYITIMGLLVEPTELDPITDTVVFQCLDDTFDEIESISEFLTLQQIATFNTMVLNRTYSVVTYDNDFESVISRNSSTSPLQIRTIE